MEVWDRVDLILKIFDKHAQSTEAKLQIELAKIKHMGPRIFKLGGELMQQEGVRGTRGGPGETNIEIMKRHLRKQEQNIMDKLKHYDVIKEGHRKRRKRQNMKSVAIVGYTNAGKSSVLKALTGKDVYIANELFATLDTRVGSLYIEEMHREVLVSDTIGFIQDLPPFLIQAFKSTLAEAIDADLLLHVIDVSDPLFRIKIEVVEEILDELKIGDKPKMYVFNKIDLINLEEEPEKNIEEPELEPEPKIRTSGVLRAGRETAELLGWLKKDTDIDLLKNPRPTTQTLTNSYEKFTPVFVSAVEKKGLDTLIKKISEKLKLA